MGWFEFMCIPLNQQEKRYQRGVNAKARASPLIYRTFDFFDYWS